MKAYKGFTSAMTCRGFQYEEGKTYETDVADICRSGFHACLLPLDTLKYYGAPCCHFHEVELDGVYSYGTMFLHNIGTTIAATKITIGKEISIPDMKTYEEKLFSDESEMDNFLKSFNTLDEAGKKYFSMLIKNYISYRADPKLNLQYIEGLLEYCLCDSDNYILSLKGRDFPYDVFREPKVSSDKYFRIMRSLGGLKNRMRKGIYNTCV